jgi:hypothetical protein
VYYDAVSLLADTVYYYKAYGINNDGTGEGEEVSFRTLAEPVKKLLTK